MFAAESRGSPADPALTRAGEAVTAAPQLWCPGSKCGFTCGAQPEPGVSRWRAARPAPASPTGPPARVRLGARRPPACVRAPPRPHARRGANPRDQQCHPTPNSFSNERGSAGPAGLGAATGRVAWARGQPGPSGSRGPWAPGVPASFLSRFRTRLRRGRACRSLPGDLLPTQSGHQGPRSGEGRGGNSATTLVCSPVL